MKKRVNWKKADHSKSDNVEIILYLRNHEDVSYVYTNNGMEWNRNFTGE